MGALSATLERRVGASTAGAMSIVSGTLRCDALDGTR